MCILNRGGGGEFKKVPSKPPVDFQPGSYFWLLILEKYFFITFEFYNGKFTYANLHIDGFKESDTEGVFKTDLNN